MQVSSLFSSLDVMPTLLSLAGLAPARPGGGQEGMDLAEQLLDPAAGGEEEEQLPHPSARGWGEGEERQERKKKCSPVGRESYLYFIQHTDAVAAIRHKQYKLIHQVNIRCKVRVMHVSFVGEPRTPVSETAVQCGGRSWGEGQPHP